MDSSREEREQIDRTTGVGMAILNHMKIIFTQKINGITFMVNDVIITRSILLNAAPERVWEALTHPGMTKQYLYNCEVSCDWETGSTMRWKGIYHGKEIEAEGKVLDIIPGRMIRYSGFDRLTEGDISRQGDVYVTHEIIPQGLKTKLLTTIEHFEGDETRAELAAQQWDFEIMPRLQTLVETTL